MKVLLLAVSVIMGLALWMLWRSQLALRREAWIRSFQLPRGLFQQLQRKHPALTVKDCQLVGHALRQFFLAHLKSGRQFVSMPSQVVDDLWHEFILHTRHYELFCRKAFGRLMHHTPAVALSGGVRQSNAGLRRCFWFACREEYIDPRRPTRLPLLFAIDAKLGIAGGFRYVADCKAARAAGDTAVHCGGEFASHGIDGSTHGFGDGGSSEGGGDAGGDGGGGDGGGDGGGGGCGGGCGGGGGD